MVSEDDACVSNELHGGGGGESDEQISHVAAARDDSTPLSGKQRSTSRPGSNVQGAVLSAHDTASSPGGEEAGGEKPQPVSGDGARAEFNCESDIATEEERPTEESTEQSVDDGDRPVQSSSAVAGDGIDELLPVLKVRVSVPQNRAAKSHVWMLRLAALLEVKVLFRLSPALTPHVATSSADRRREAGALDPLPPMGRARPRLPLARSNGCRHRAHARSASRVRHAK